MLETAIIGGGLSGIALARSLFRQGRSVSLFEARPRLGGRILSVPSAMSARALDLGPTWFWPDTQPLITQLVAELQLADFPQHDEGAVLHLRDPDKSPDRIEDKSVHNGARRLTGGMAALIDALAVELPETSIHLDHALIALRDAGDRAALRFSVGGELRQVEARCVVLTIPPRLVLEQVRFEPELDAATQDAMRATGTWMAAQAKIVIEYDRAYWREAGDSGNAFVTHEQAVIGEIFDTCDAAGEQAALGGFLAFMPELRRSFAVGLPMLMGSQMAQVFGSRLERHGALHYMDWASEPHTCSALDRSAPEREHSGFSNPLLRRALWGDKLYLCGSETATHGAGYLEGALDAARRVHRALARAAVPAAAASSARAAGDPVAINTASLARFGDWVAAQADTAFDDYCRRLSRSLAAQHKEQLTQRAMLESIEEVYRRALEVLDGLTFDMSGVAVERGRSALTPDVQRPFRDLMQSLLDDVIAFNRTSCALSNFPHEHQPSKEYVQTILRDVAAAWQEFSLSANRMLLAKADTAEGGPHGSASIS
jgi:monoamine oxidase